jgi:hypothetical protein
MRALEISIIVITPMPLLAYNTKSLFGKICGKNKSFFSADFEYKQNDGLSKSRFSSQFEGNNLRTTRDRLGKCHNRIPVCKKYV